jgi:hypothetical protein
VSAARFLLLTSLAIAAAAVACSSPSPDQRFVATVPDRASFPAVAQLYVHRCGSLDCHGTPYRNLRIYGNEGLRLDPQDRPLSPMDTTPREIDEDYASVVGLEPEVLSQVVSQGGASPERLTLVRKPLGLESHKGGQLFQPGDNQDVCVRSWLAGSANATACAQALMTP